MKTLLLPCLVLIAAPLPEAAWASPPPDLARVLAPGYLRGPEAPAPAASAPAAPAAGALDTLLQEVEEDWEEGAWHASARTSYFFDSQNKLARELQESKPDSVWNPDSLVLFRYNAQGRLIESRIQRWRGDAWGDDGLWTIGSDAAGRRTSVVRQYWGVDAWINFSRSDYQYATATATRAAVDLHQTWNNSMWEDLRRVRRSYDTTTRTQTELTEDWINGAWTPRERSLYVYGANGYLDKIVEQSWSDTAWKDETLLDYTILVPPGRITEVLIASWNENKWDNAYLVKLAYQGSRQTVILYQQWKDQAWSDIFRIRNVYGAIVPVAIRRGPEGGLALRRLPGPGLRFQTTEAGPFVASILTPQGKLIGYPRVDRMPGGLAEISWNGRKHSGIRAGRGSYLLSVRAGARRATTPFFLQ